MRTFLQRLLVDYRTRSRRRPVEMRLGVEALEDRLTPAHTVAVAVVNPPVEFVEGTAIALTSTVTGATSPTYEWSVTKDQVAFATGTPTDAADFSFTPDDNASYTITLTVTDGDHAVVDSSTVLTVVNAVPTASIAGPTVGVPGQPLSFTVSAVDPSSVDQAKGFTYQIDWNDGSASETVSATDGNGSGVAVTHTFATTGTFQVAVTATDKDNGTSTTTTLSVTISTTAVVDGTLFVGGTDGNDRINIVPKGPQKTGKAAVKVLMNGASQGVFRGVQAIQVFAQGGDDRVNVAGAIRVPATLDGGPGNDRLKGGAGKDLLLGGDDNDHLNGHTNNDVLIGGTGRDRLIGGPGEDLLIGGSLTFAVDPAALAALAKAWSASSAVGVRVTALSDPAAAVAITFSGASATVIDDGEVDVLTGAARTDWFVASLPQDVVTDLHGNEFLNDGKASGKGNGKGNGNKGNGKGK